MPSSMAGHSHKSTTKVGHKPFKAAGKGRRHKGLLQDDSAGREYEKIFSNINAQS